MRHGFPFKGDLALYIIRLAWEAGMNVEDLADGFGPGRGTDGDWSAIRDSSHAAVEAMLDRALRFIEARVHNRALA
jgi:aryl-alcohol dehydrogenase-like predicted oxidoreductase